MIIFSGINQNDFRVSSKITHTLSHLVITIDDSGSSQACKGFDKYFVKNILIFGD